MTIPVDSELMNLVDEGVPVVPNFPKKGIMFRDITPFLANGSLFRNLILALADSYRGKIDYVAGPESRGFIFAAPLAVELGIGMLTIRKKGKLPGKVTSVDYCLEYNKATMEIRCETVPHGARVLIVDDVLATGGTACATAELLRRCGAEVVGMLVLIELTDMGGREKLSFLNVDSVIATDEHHA